MTKTPCNKLSSPANTDYTPDHTFSIAPMMEWSNIFFSTYKTMLYIHKLLNGADMAQPLQPTVPHVANDKVIFE